MRARYWWDPVSKKLVDHPPQEQQARLQILTDSPAYDGLRTTDGIDISSRKKRAEYMRLHGLADQTDYSSETMQRNREATWTELDRTRKRDLVEAMKAVEAGYRPRLRKGTDE